MDNKTFTPVILFHDVSYTQPDLRLVQTSKQKIENMLETNNRIWADLVNSTRQWSTNPCTSPHLSHSSCPSPLSPTIHHPSTPPNEYHRRCKEESWSNEPQFSVAVPKRMSDSDTDLFEDSELDGKRRRGNLPKPVTAILKHWLIDHCRNPYPTEDEKNALRADTGLTLNQISNWFINARRRILPLILEKKHPGEIALKRRRRNRRHIDAKRSKRTSRSSIYSSQNLPEDLLHTSP